MDVSVGQHDASVLFRHKGHVLYADAVGIGCPIEDAKLTVVHVSQLELMLVFGKVEDIVCRLVAAVQDAVEDNHLLDTVQSLLLLKAVPRRLRDDALTAKAVQVSLDGIVCRSEHRIMSTSGKQLQQRRLGIRADWPLAKQTDILTVVVLLLQVLRYRLVRENISRGRIYLVRASCQAYCHDCCNKESLHQKSLLLWGMPFAFSHPAG